MAIAGDGMFSASIASFVGKVAAQNTQVCRKTAIDVFTGILFATPVKTGVTRNNWLPSTGSPASGTREIADETGDASAAEIKAVISGWQPEKEDAFLANNSIVAVVHEYGLYPNPPKKGTGKTINGYSTQAVGGMVGLTIAKKKGG